MQIKINVNITEAYTKNDRWCATFDSYDGAPDSGNRNRMGFGPDMQDAICDLILIHLDDELESNAQGSGTPSTTSKDAVP